MTNRGDQLEISRRSILGFLGAAAAERVLAQHPLFSTMKGGARGALTPTKAWRAIRPLPSIRLTAFDTPQAASLTSKAFTMDAGLEVRCQPAESRKNSPNPIHKMRSQSSSKTSPTPDKREERCSPEIGSGSQHPTRLSRSNKNVTVS